MFIDDIFRIRDEEYRRARYAYCPERAKDYSVTYRGAHKNDPEYQKKRKQEGRAYRATHLDEIVARKQGLKKTVLSYYGKEGMASCVVCGETRLDCLSIDHINGGGTQQRKSIGGSSHSMYRWLKKQGYPKGYQTLCMNCQFIKRVENKETRKT